MEQGNKPLNSIQGLRILLISVNNLWRYSNVGVDQIAGYLRLKGYNVDILYHHKNVNYHEVINKLILDYDIYGFSVNSSNCKCCLELINFIKEHQSTAITVVGGGFPTRYYREIFEKSQAVDYVILGDGELPFESLLQNIFFGHDLSMSDNIATISDYEKKLSYCNSQINYFPAYDYYLNDTKLRNARKEYCIQTKNNICTGRCSFCTERKGAAVYKEISHIITEIEYVSKHFGIKKFFFTDDNILDPNNNYAKQRMKILCSEIQKLNLNLVFKCYIKSISLSDSEEDNKLLNLMSETGFKTIFVGIESGNETDLKLYNKHVAVSDNYTILKLLKRHGIVAQIGFINFNPYSTLETIRENYEFLSRIEMNNLFMYVCSYLRVYKYTDIYNKMQHDGLLIDKYDYLDDRSLYEFIDPETKKIFDFIYNYMIARVRNLDFEFDWLYSFYMECKKINPEAATFEDEFNFLHQNQFEAIRAFFYILFVQNDIEKCRKEVESFLTFFENLQPRFFEIHRELLDMYLK